MVCRDTDSSIPSVHSDRRRITALVPPLLIYGKLCHVWTHLVHHLMLIPSPAHPDVNKWWLVIEHGREEPAFVCAGRQIIVIMLLCILLVTAAQICTGIWMMESGAGVSEPDCALSPVWMFILRGHGSCVYFTSLQCRKI